MNGIVLIKNYPVFIIIINRFRPDLLKFNFVSLRKHRSA